jgi:hypothetical protein
MFASGSKSSGGSRGFSLEAGKIPKPAATRRIQDFSGNARLKPLLPPLLCYPRGRRAQ